MYAKMARCLAIRENVTHAAVIYLRSMQPLLRRKPTRGYDRTWEQCRRKMKNFIMMYKKVDKHEA